MVTGLLYRSMEQIHWWILKTESLSVKFQLFLFAIGFEDLGSDQANLLS